MPFGLTNAPRSFQMAVHKLFSGKTFVRCYLDDILIFSQDNESHKIHLREVLDITLKDSV